VYLGKELKQREGMDGHGILRLNTPAAANMLHFRLVIVLNTLVAQPTRVSHILLKPGGFYVPAARPSAPSTDAPPSAASSPASTTPQPAHAQAQEA
jgi:hypothetical protein